MKKIISMLLVLAMTVIGVPAMADNGEAEAMERVLIKVKEHIGVPEELTEFSGNSSEHNGEKSYSFEWTSADYEKSMSVSCDSNGHIKNYYSYNGQGRTQKKLSPYSKDEIISFAEEFLRKTVPETFENENDRFFVDESSYRAGGSLRYSVSFVRKNNGARVNNNYAEVMVSAQDEKLSVRNMTANYDYDGVFEEVGTEISDYAEKYKELFPTELVYVDEYQPQAKANEPGYTPRLIWRIKDGSAGYMDICTGEIIEEDSVLMHKESAAEDSVMNAESASGGGSLSFRETAELENIQGLFGADEIINKIKALPYVSIGDNLEGETYLYKDRSGKYFYRLNYFGDEDYFYARANAETGEILSISARGEYSNEELSEAQIESAEKKISEFLSKTGGRLSETEKTEISVNKGKVSINFVRIANGVKYFDNGISVTFDAKNDKIIGYNSDFTDGELPDVKNAITQSMAYDVILENCDIIPVYVKSNGKYKKAVILENGCPEIDAFTGELINGDKSERYEYRDLDGHWAKEAAVKLSEIGVGISGGELLPDKKMTQEEFLRLAASAIIGSYYGGESKEEFYEQLIADGYLKENEQAPDAEIKREDTFVAIIRMAGLEKVAKLSEIYRLDFADNELLPKEKIGYAAILTGMKVISGDNASIRPKDSVTRAEAMVMLYRYLLTL